MKVVGLGLLFLFSAFSQSFAHPVTEVRTRGLVVRGQVARIEVQKEKDAVFFFVFLNVEFVNSGAEPIILFKPSVESAGSDERYWLGGWSLFVNREDVSTDKSIFRDEYWESTSGSDGYRQLAQRLDVKTPPKADIRVLKPGDSWKTQDHFRIYFEAERHRRIPEHRTWAEMQVFPKKLWLTIDYEISPWNVEYFKPDLIRKLSKRWKTFGNVLVDEKKEGQFNQFIVSSEPMTIDFTQAAERSEVHKVN